MDDEIWVALSFGWKFSDSPQDCGRKFSLKSWAFKQFFGSSQVYQFHRASEWCNSLEWRNVINIVYHSGFGCKFQLRKNFSHGFFANSCQKNIFFRTCRHFQKFLMLSYKQPIKIVLRDAHWVAFRRRWELFRVRFVVDRCSGQGTL